MNAATINAYDVVVIGGGAAGLNGALLLARARRSVVIVDSGRPRYAPAQGVHGLLGHDGVPPAELLERGRAEVRRYGGEVVTGKVENVRRDEGRFVVSLTDGRNVSARRILVTTGLVDELPAITGLRERWGRDVLHCRYCHGWEVRDKEIGVLANGPRSVHQALLFRQLSDRVTYFTNGTRLLDDEAEQLAARDVRIVAGRIDSLVVADNALCGVQLEDGTVVDAQAFAVMPHMVARRRFPRPPRVACRAASVGHRRTRNGRSEWSHERSRRVGRRQRHRHRGPSRRVRSRRSIRRTADQRGSRRRGNRRRGCPLPERRCGDLTRNGRVAGAHSDAA